MQYALTVNPHCTYLDLFHDAISRFACGGDEDGHRNGDWDEDGRRGGSSVQGHWGGQVHRYRNWDQHWFVLHFICNEKYN